MASGIQLKVSPDILKSQAAQITKEINAIERQWSNLKSTVQRSKSYWEGDASNTHQKFITQSNNDVDKVLRRLKEHPKDLLQMAKLYNEAEEKAKQMAGKLPEDIIK